MSATGATVASGLSVTTLVAIAVVAPAFGVIGAHIRHHPPTNSALSYGQIGAII